MPSLLELQEWMRRVIVDPRGAGPALSDEPSGADWIAHERGIGALPRLDVYAEAYFLRLSEALATDYPVLRATLGEERFLKLVARYLANYPSRSPNITDAGASLPAFLEGSAEEPLLCDLARLEWARIESFYEAHSPGFDPATLAQLNWDHARVKLAPSLRFVDVSYPVHLLPGDVPLALSGLTLVTYRHGAELGSSRIATEALERAEGELLRSLACGDLLNDALAGYVPSDVARWFERWARLGWIRKIVAI